MGSVLSKVSTEHLHLYKLFLFFFGIRISFVCSLSCCLIIGKLDFLGYVWLSENLWENVKERK